MKLHLPKALLTAILATVCCTSGWAETYNLLESEVGWTLSSTTYNLETDSISASNWGGNKYATYTVADGKSFTASTETALTFSFTYTISGDGVANNSVQTFAFAGDDYAIVFGTERFEGYSGIGYGTTADNSATHYGVSDSPALKLTPFDGATRTNPGEYTINGTVSNINGEYQMSVTLSAGDTTYSGTVNLGYYFNINRFVFTSEGHDRSLTALTINGDLVDSADTSHSYSATLAANSTAASAAPWTKVGTEKDINLTDGTADLQISADANGSTLLMSKGSNVKSIQAVSNNVTIQSSDASAVKANYLHANDGAELIIDTELVSTAPGKITGNGAIRLNQNANFANGLNLENNNVYIAKSKTLYMGGSINGSGVISGEGSVNLLSGLWNVRSQQTYTGGTTVGADGTLILSTGGQKGALRGKVDVYGTLKMNKGDVTGWDNSANVISEINLYSGGSVNVNTTENQTAAGLAINLHGGSLTGISGSNMDLFYGGGNKYATINALAAEGATAENPTVSTISGVKLGIRQNQNVFSVAENARLEISSVIADRTNDGMGNDPNQGNAHTITKTGAGELVLTGAYSLPFEVKIDGGTLSFTGNTNASIGRLHSAMGRINVGKDSTNTSKLTVTGIEVGDNNSGINDTLYVSEGSLLKITGSTNSDSDMKSASIIIGEWGASTTVTLDGSMLAKDAYVMAGIKGGIFNINGTGTLAAKGIYKNAGRTDGGVIDIVLNDGGKLILGADGISSDIYTNGITLKDGIVGTYADEMTISKSMSLAGTQGTTFDTDKYKFADDGNSISKPENTTGSTIIIAAAMSGEGKLVKTGAGTLKLDATNTYSGGTSVEAGMLEVSANEGLGTGKVEVASGATLQIGLGVGITTVSGIDLAGGATLDLRNGGQGNSTVDTAITTGDGAIIRAGFNGSNTIINGSISGSGNLTLAQNKWGGTYTTDTWNILAELKDKSETEKLSIIYTEGTLAKFSGNNTYSGGTTITGGTLTTASENALGTGTVKMQGGTLEMAAALSVTAMEYTSGTVNTGSHNLNVGTLTVAEGATMSLSGSGATTAAVVDLKSGASLSAAGELTMGSLTMADGSKLAASGTITLSGADNRVLDLGSKLTLDGEWFENLLAELTGSNTATLFEGVTELKLNGVAYANQVDLADHFLNVEQGKYYLAYANSVVYAGLGEVIPEPTTATLSLLALAGLCTRRRRRA